MSDLNDSSFEMHEEDLSPEEVEHLVNGVSERPDLAELALLLADVRRLPDRVGTPAVSVALSEFVGVDLTPNPEPIVLTEVDDTPVSAAIGSQEAEPVRRNSMIGQLAAFLGTIGGKVVVGTTVAAASVGGVHASGVVDVPFLPDNEPAEIETIDLPEDPDALAFVDEKDDHENEEKKPEQKVVEEGDADVKKDEKNVEKKVEKKPYFEDDFDDYPEHKNEDPADKDVEDEVKEEPKKEEPKVEEPKKEEPKKEEPKEEISEAEKAKQELIAALEEEVHLAKDAVRAAATALIKPLEEERDGLLAGLEETHHALALEWEGVIESLLADLEGTEDEAERAAIEELIDAAEASWAEARVAAELEVDPRLEEINDLFHVIETERDAEIDRLLAEFRAAVEEIENS